MDLEAGRIRRGGVRALVALAAIGGALLGPGAGRAVASAVQVSGGDVFFIAGSGEANRLTITGGGGSLTLDDAGVTFIRIDSPGCTVASGDANRVTCTAPADAMVDVRLFDGDDTATATGVTSAIQWQDGGGDDAIDGGDAADTFFSGAGDDTFGGGAGDDSFFPDAAAAGSDTFDGGAGTDTMRYDSGTLFDAGVDVSEDGLANDGLEGQTDDVGADIEVLEGTDGRDILRGGAGAESLRGNAGDDLLDGGPGNDSLVGADGDDTLIGGTGSDDMQGGDALGDTGLDVVSYEDRGPSAGVTASLATGSGGAAVGGESDSFFQVEALHGGGGADTLTGDSGDNTIDGGSGSDVSLSGGDGDDVVLGRDGADAVNGGAGDDVLRAGAGNDVLSGNGGADDVFGDGGVDAVFDYLSAPAGVTVTLDDVANDGPDGDDVHSDVETVYGSSFGDTLVGSDAGNQLFGVGGDDTLAGGGGDDSLDGGAGADALDGGSGADRLTGGAGDDALAAVDAGADRLLDCGADTDSAVADVEDPATTGCETEARRAPQATLSASAHDFGSVTAGTRSAAFAFTVTNTGDRALRVGTLTLGGADAARFALGSDGCSGAVVSPGASCSFAVAFAPAAVGARRAAVSIGSDDPAGVATIALSGTGAAPVTTPPGGQPGGGGPPAGGGGTTPATGGKARRHRAPALLRVSRAQLAHHRLRVTATLTRRADGARVRVSFHGRRYTRTVRHGRVRLSVKLRRPRPGRVTIAYAGSGTVRPARTGLRAARRAPGLKVRHHRLRGRRLTVDGTAARSARGHVQLLVTWEDRAFKAHRFKRRATIHHGRWHVRARLPRGTHAATGLRVTYAGRGALSGQQLALRP